MKARELNETSWILVKHTGNNCGVVSNTPNGVRLVKPNANLYESVEELVSNEFPYEKFEGFEERETVVKENAVVNGFEVKHANVVNIKEEEINGKLLSIYNNDEKSEVEFVAGLFGIAFSGGMSCVNCPKKKTLLDNEFIGPYTTEFDTKFHINTWKRDNGLS